LILLTRRGRGWRTVTRTVTIECSSALKLIDGARERRRLVREQKRQVSKVLLNGLYDSNSPVSKLLGVRTEVMGEIIWKKMLDVWNWQIYPGQ